MLQDHDRIVPSLRSWIAGRTAAERLTLAQLWSLLPGLASAPDKLADAMLRSAAVERLLNKLGSQERAALAYVQAEGGVISEGRLEREFGSVRQYGNYPNPRAYLLSLSQPASPAERLWIMALIQDVQRGAIRQFAIPPDLLTLLPPVALRDRSLRLAPGDAPPRAYDGEARPFERNLLVLLTLAHDGQLEVIPSGALNKASLVRLVKILDPGEDLKGVSREEQWPYIRFLRQVAEGTGLLRAGSDARLRPARAALEWMRLPQIERTRRLLDGWVASSWDELPGFVGLKLQHAYSRDLPATKRAILRLFAQVPPQVWVPFDDFIAAVKTAEPDFARADGRYDSWGIVNYLRQPVDGFEHWDEVEGEQLRSIAGGTLSWLGLTDLGMDGDRPRSFRINSVGAALLRQAPPPPEPPTEPLIIQPNFEVLVRRDAALEARFQIARIAKPVSSDPQADAAIYRLTRQSIQAALERDVALDDILRFLSERGGPQLPQNVAATVREWAGEHGQISLRQAVLLEAREPALLEQIKRDKRVRLPQVEPLANTIWAVRPGDAPALAERLRKASYGLMSELDAADGPLREHDMTVLVAALEFYVHACAALGIEGEASGALRQRAAKLLPEQQLNRAYRSSHEALRQLKEQLGHTKRRPE